MDRAALNHELKDEEGDRECLGVTAPSTDLFHRGTRALPLYVCNVSLILLLSAACSQFGVPTDS